MKGILARIPWRTLRSLYFARTFCLLLSAAAPLQAPAAAAAASIEAPN